ncbi:MAG: hypothetical protein DRQ59_10750 [Gammaproteobacteria bacterium]|nr:MAG: hypothetical protein DRQ59_10750 [Gammaproteobacteria bacterium]
MGCINKNQTTGSQHQLMSGMFTKKNLEEGMWLFLQIFDPGNNLILPRAQINSFVIPAQAGIHCVFTEFSGGSL